MVYSADDIRKILNMTHLNLSDSNIEIKVEPVSPAEVTCQMDMNLETCQGQDQAITYGTPNAPLSPAWQSQQVPVHQCLTPQGHVFRRESQPIGPTTGTRMALKQKIQSERRARGQKELVVKFEPGVKSELTDVEIKKREKRKEQNRRAARKCRNKKRQLQQFAQQHASSLLQENLDLKDTNTKLRAEVNKYKQLLVDHKNSGKCRLGNRSSSSCPLTLDYQTPTTSTSVSSSVPLSLSQTPLSRSEEACIEKIAEDLQREAALGIHPSPCSPFTLPESNPMLSSTGDEFDLIDSIIFDDMDSCTHPSLGSQFDGTATTEDKINGELCAGNDALPVFSNTSTPKPRGVRNLNHEFAQCAIGSTSDASLNRIPFCSYQNSTYTTDVQHPDHLNNFCGHRDSYLGNESFPESPQSCISSPPATSPSLLFHSPAEHHGYSPMTVVCEGTPSHIFQFPPYTRSSPSP